MGPASLAPSLSPSMLKKMTSQWLNLLSDYGFKDPLEEMTWCTTAYDNCKAEISVRNTIITRAPRDVGFKPLGTKMTFNWKLYVELQNRIDCMWMSFHVYSYIFMSPKFGVKRRLTPSLGPGFLVLVC